MLAGELAGGSQLRLASGRLNLAQARYFITSADRSLTRKQLSVEIFEDISTIAVEMSADTQQRAAARSSVSPSSVQSDRAYALAAVRARLDTRFGYHARAIKLANCKGFNLPTSV